MRKISIVLLSIILVLGFYACNKKVEKQNNEQLTHVKDKQNAEIVNGIDAILPDNSIIIMKFKGVSSFYEEIVPALKLDENDMTKVIENIGFNPLKYKELNEFGIDQKGEFGIVFSELKIVDYTYKEPPVMNLSMFMPVIEGKDVAKKIVDIISKKAPSSVKLEKRNGYYLFPGKVDSPAIAVKQYKEFVFITLAFRSEPNVLYSQLGKNPVGNYELYKRLVKENGNKGGFSVFVNFKNTTMLNDLSEMFNKQRGGGATVFNMFEGYQGAYMTLDTSSPDFILKATGLVDKNSSVLNLYKNIEYCRSSVLAVKDNPLFYFSVSVNPGEYYKMIQKAFTRKQIDAFNNVVGEFKEKSGIDLIEVINMLGGNFNYAMYDGKSINMMKYNTVFSISFNDEQKGLKLLDNLLGLLKEKAGDKMVIKKENVAGIKTYVATASMAQFYLGIKNSALIFSTGKDYYEQAVAGDIEKGFTSKLDKDLAEKFVNSDIFYLSFDEGMKVFENFKPLMMMGMRTKVKNPNESDKKISKIKNIVNQFKYIVSSSTRITDGLNKINFRIKTRFNKSFILGVIDMIKSFNKKQEVKKKKKTPVNKSA